MTNDDNFLINKTGKLTKAQKRFLYTWFFYRLVGLVLPGLLIGFGLRTPVGWLIVVIVAVLAVLFIWQYSTDIWQQMPTMTYGRVKKQTMRTRGPTQYYIIFSNGTRVRTDKSEWEKIEESVAYRAYYTEKTKWLLSYSRN